MRTLHFATVNTYSATLLAACLQCIFTLLTKVITHLAALPSVARSAPPIFVSQQASTHHACVLHTTCYTPLDRAHFAPSAEIASAQQQGRPLSFTSLSAIEYSTCTKSTVFENLVKEEEPAATIKKAPNLGSPNLADALSSSTFRSRLCH
jgi:hypothetical protein